MVSYLGIQVVRGVLQDTLVDLGVHQGPLVEVHVHNEVGGVGRNQVVAKDIPRTLAEGVLETFLPVHQVVDPQAHKVVGHHDLVVVDHTLGGVRVLEVVPAMVDPQVACHIQKMVHLVVHHILEVVHHILEEVHHILEVVLRILEVADPNILEVVHHILEVVHHIQAVVARSLAVHARSLVAVAHNLVVVVRNLVVAAHHIPVAALLHTPVVVSHTPAAAHRALVVAGLGVAGHAQDPVVLAHVPMAVEPHILVVGVATHVRKMILHRVEGECRKVNVRVQRCGCGCGCGHGRGCATGPALPACGQENYHIARKVHVGLPRTGPPACGQESLHIVRKMRAGHPRTGPAVGQAAKSLVGGHSHHNAVLVVAALTVAAPLVVAAATGSSCRCFAPPGVGLRKRQSQAQGKAHGQGHAASILSTVQAAHGQSGRNRGRTMHAFSRC